MSRPVTPLQRSLASIVLGFEALVLFFAGLVARSQSSLDPGVALGLASALAVLCLAVCGVLGRRWGYWVGGALQLAIIGFGVWVPSMYFLGALFAALWVAALVAADRAVQARARLEAALGGTEPGAQAADGRSGAGDTRA